MKGSAPQVVVLFEVTKKETVLALERSFILYAQLLLDCFNVMFAQFLICSTSMHLGGIVGAPSGGFSLV